MLSHDEAIEEARKHYLAKNYNESYRLVDVAISLKFNSTEAYLLKSLLYFRKNGIDEALYFIDIVLYFNPTSLIAKYYRYFFYKFSGNISEIANSYSLINTISLHDIDLVLDRVLALHILGNDEQAFRCLFHLIQNDKNFNFTIEYLNENYFKYDEFNNFNKNLSNLIKIYPEFFNIFPLIVRAFYQSGKYTESLQIITKIDEYRKDDIILLEQKINCLFKLNKFSECEIYCLKYLEIQQNNDQIFYTLALVLYQQQKYEMIEKYLDNAIKLTSKFKDAYLKFKGNYYLKIGEISKALNCFRESVEINKSDLQLYLQIALIEYKICTLEDALKTLNLSISRFPDSEDVHINKVIFLTKINNLTQAKHLSNYLVSKFPSSYIMHYNLGIMLYKLENFEQAIIYFDKSYELSGKKFYKSLLKKVRILRETKKENLYLSELIRIQKENRDDTEISYEIAQIYYSKSKFDYAFEYVNIALLKNPDNLEYLQLKADILAEKKCYSEALSILLMIKKNIEDDYLLLQKIGKCFFKINKIQDAKKYLLKSIEIKTKEHVSHYFLSLIHFKEKLFFKSLDHINKAININPSISKLYYQKSKIYFELENFEEAKKNITIAMTLEGENPEYYLKLGKILQKENNHALALENFKNAIKYGITDYRPTYYSSLSFIKMKNKKFADRLLKEAVNNINEEHFYIFHLFVQNSLYVNSDEFNNNFTNNLVQKYPKNPESFIARATYLNHYRNFHESINFISKALAKFKHPELYYKKSVAELNLGKLEDARESLNDAIRISLDNWKYVLEKAFIDYNLRDYDQAIDSLRLTLHLLNKEKQKYFSNETDIELPKAKYISSQIETIEKMIDFCSKCKTLTEKFGYLKTILTIYKEFKDKSESFANKLKDLIKNYNENYSSFKISDNIIYDIFKKFDANEDVFLSGPFVSKIIVDAQLQNLNSILSKAILIQSKLVDLAEILGQDSLKLNDILESHYFSDSSKKHTKAPQFKLSTRRKVPETIDEEPEESDDESAICIKLSTPKEREEESFTNHSILARIILRGENTLSSAKRLLSTASSTEELEHDTSPRSKLQENLFIDSGVPNHKRDSGVDVDVPPDGSYKEASTTEDRETELMGE